MKTILLYGILLSQLVTALGASSELSRQQKIVAITILAEARGEGDSGMGAVAAVIAQRAIDRKQTWEKVCLAKWQFSCWNGKSVKDLEHLLNVPQAEMAIYLAKNMHRIDRSKIGNANHYYADYIKAPYWAKGKKPVKKIGHHIFYKL